MAEERTLGLAPVAARSEEADPKEELQRRLELTRDSISQTVTEIKENVAHQVQAVKDSLDWREQFKRRPVAWSAGALGVGLIAGYKVAGAFKGETDDRVHTTAYGYSARPLVSEPPSAAPVSKEVEDDGPGITDRIRGSSAYELLSKEMASLGNKAVSELSTTAHVIVLPFLLAKLKQWIGIDRLERSTPVIRS